MTVQQSSNHLFPIKHHLEPHWPTIFIGYDKDIYHISLDKYVYVHLHTQYDFQRSSVRFSAAFTKIQKTNLCTKNMADRKMDIKGRFFLGAFPFSSTPFVYLDIG